MVACNNCRKKKLKCSGARPICQNCAKTHGQCVYQAESNETRNESLKRKASELENQVQQLDRVLSSLRSGSEQDIRAVLDRLQNAESMELAVSEISNASLLLSSISGNEQRTEPQSTMTATSTTAPQTSSGEGHEEQRLTDIRRSEDSVTQYQVDELLGHQSVKPGRAYFDHIIYPFVSRLNPDVWDPLNLLPSAGLRSKAITILKIPPLSVTAAPWADVDDGFASHLLQYYFTFEQPFYSFVMKEPFLAAMNAGEPSDARSPFRFCSKALVNGILAVACKSSFCKEAFDVPNDLSSRGVRFIDATKQAIEVEKQSPSIATLQAVMKVMWYEGGRGQMWNQPYYGGLLLELYGRMGLANLSWTENSMAKATETSKIYDAVADTLWGLYWQDSIQSLTMAIDPRIQRPKIPLPEVGEAEDWWYPYPLVDAPQLSRFRETLRARVMLADLIREVVKFTRSSTDLDGALRIYERIRRWKRDLPECLVLANTKLPHVLLMHTVYDCMIITLFRALASTTTVNRIPTENPQLITVDHAIHTMSIISIYRSLYTVLRSPAPIIGLMTSTFALLFHLDHSTSATDAFIQAVQGLSEMSLNWPPTLSMLRGVKAIALKSGIDIPPAAMRYMDVEGEMSKQSDIPIPAALPKGATGKPKGLPERVDKAGRVYLDGVDEFLRKLTLEVD
ncbi:hypothetical protein NA57DRAFT_61831 [Rhizodiscina lignyota]|uniref:Zn(2)-C6 fungal-type domain-containing protein n=1 Tax=Rhizodiscina lignyota TaxID=1504668 RepID=A0A9P4I6I5_9PEZI|nr:hypothetical protein NA57DRAFT_61831 [Rhizodiscina lignyota]